MNNDLLKPLDDNVNGEDWSDDESEESDWEDDDDSDSGNIDNETNSHDWISISRFLNFMSFWSNGNTFEFMGKWCWLKMRLRATL